MKYLDAHASTTNPRMLEAPCPELAGRGFSLNSDSVNGGGAARSNLGDAARYSTPLISALDTPRCLFRSSNRYRSTKEP